MLWAALARDEPETWDGAGREPEPEPITYATGEDLLDAARDLGGG